MGVSYNQHRITTGLFNVSKVKKSKYTKNNSVINKWPKKVIFAAFLLTLYVYAICILLAGAITTACDVPKRAELHNVKLGGSLFDTLGSFLNLSLVLILSLLYNRHRVHVMMQPRAKQSCFAGKHPQAGFLSLVGKAISISASAFNLGTTVCTNPFYLCLLFLKVSFHVGTYALRGNGTPRSGASHGPH